MLSDNDIAGIVEAEESASLGFLGEGSTLQRNRATLLDYYFQQPYGDEIEGMSSIVTSDVHDVVEGMLPQLIRLFEQNKHLAKFIPTREEYEEECKQKQEYVTYVLKSQHDFTKILYDLAKDGLLQYTGTGEVDWVVEKQSEEQRFLNLSDTEKEKVIADGWDIDREEETDQGIVTYVSREREVGENRISVCPPDEFMVSKRAKDFYKPPLIGKRPIKTKSDLVSMGFDPELVATFGVDDDIDNDVELSRETKNIDQHDSNPTNDTSKDLVYLGSYFVEMDVDEDGIVEYWKVYYSNGKVLEKKKVDDHNMFVFVPIPMPHTTIGTCPADEVADLQFWKSTLVRQMNNNVYATNYGRVLYNERVDPDDLLNPKHGGGISVEGVESVGDSVFPLQVPNQVPAVLQAIEYVDSTKEIRTGVTRYNQGVDTESLNKTATGFQGIRDMSQMRIELIARMLASALKRMCELIVKNAALYQDEKMQIRAHGQTIEIDPSSWMDKSTCHINIGTGQGDQQQRIANLNYILTIQRQMWVSGSLLTDQSKIFNTLDKLINESGLYESNLYFNDPTQTLDVLQAENEQLKKIVQQLQANAQNPLAEAERVRGELRLQEKAMDNEAKLRSEILKLQQQLRDRSAELAQKERFHDDDMAVELTKIEQSSKPNQPQNVPGSLI